jgi:hypothetical protein
VKVKRPKTAPTFGLVTILQAKLLLAHAAWAKSRSVLVIRRESAQQIPWPGVQQSTQGIGAEIPQGRHRADRGIGANSPDFVLRIAQEKKAPRKSNRGH